MVIDYAYKTPKRLKHTGSVQNTLPVWRSQNLKIVSEEGIVEKNSLVEKAFSVYHFLRNNYV